MKDQWMLVALVALIAVAIQARRRKIVDEWTYIGTDGKCWRHIRRSDGSEDEGPVPAEECIDVVGTPPSGGGGSSSGGGAGASW